MKWILKIFAAPLVVALTLTVWFSALFLRISAVVFGLAVTLLGLLGLAVLLTSSVTNGIILFVMAFLVSPLGLPMAAVWLVGQVQRLRYAIQDRVYG
jgi:hypothetical protein